ncbi:Oidioi.mRNA.OKI2018_I69.PAR.g12629.t1.cds [Oikopleura dioica]|uniref:UTP--glucose-1-phosphate uridylyltransferase n=1 Tax=Oikopleura dioica TaxID=34765 RepID=A0ABN7S5E6_OIKDI|nr:Oidioi.mRNA.OKI2018_I69.PAR.g12629.t1.cds [Oikopleura dioica]
MIRYEWKKSLKAAEKKENLIKINNYSERAMQKAEDDKKEFNDWLEKTRTAEATKKALIVGKTKVVVIKLNGGRGTSTGFTCPKSIISVRSGLNFLDLTVQQIEHLNKTYETNVPLVLMNSFNTEEDTRKILRKNNNCQDLYNLKDGTHGDIYMALYDSGLIEELIKQGKHRQSWRNRRHEHPRPHVNPDNKHCMKIFSEFKIFNTNNFWMRLDAVDRL